MPADLRPRIVELEAAVDATLQRVPRRDRRRARRRQHDLPILRTSDDTDERQAGVGGVEAGRRRGRRPGPRAGRGPQPGRPAASGTATTSRWRSPPASSTRTGCSRRSTRSTRPPPRRSRRGRPSSTRAWPTRFGCTVDELRPWHYDDPFFQEPPAAGAVDLDPCLADADLDALTLRTYDGLGLDVRAVVDRSDLLPRPGKSQHAFCIDVDREGDVRVLCNNTPNERWTETMLHEFGHALYDTSVDPDLPWLLRSVAHPLTTEGVAMLFGRLVRDPEWLRRRRRADRADEVDGARARSSPRPSGSRSSSFARWVLVMTHFERGLYADPDADHDSRWWDLVERFQLVRRPDGRHAPDWAAKIHLAPRPSTTRTTSTGSSSRRSSRPRCASEAGGIVDRPEAGRLLVDALLRARLGPALGRARRARDRRAAHRRAPRRRARPMRA